MRLFISIELDKDSVEILSQIKESLPKEVKVSSDNHITLKFLGEVNDKLLPLINKRLNTVEFNSFDLKLQGTGYFPNDKKPKVFWIGLYPEKEVVILAKKIQDSLEGVFKKEEKIKPHLTLARMKKPAKINVSIPPTSFKVKSFYLKQSILKPEGAEYKTLNEFISQD